MTKPLRILHVLGVFNRGGIETWLLHLLRGIDRQRFQLDFLVHTDAPGIYDADVRALGGTLLHCPYPVPAWKYARRFRRLLHEQEPYDVVHSHVHFFSGFVLRLARQAGVPLRIAHSHTTEQPREGLLRRSYLALMRHWLSRHATVCLSASRQAHQALFGPSAQECFLRCGIDLTPFAQEVDSAAVRAELGLPADAFVLGHVARFVPVKNHTLLVAVAAEVLRYVPNTYLLLVGDGELRPTIEAEAVRRRIRHRVVFTGGRGDVARLMKGAMDVFVFPSLCEGLALAAIEAQAAGLPCVFSGGVPEEATVVPALVRRLAPSQPAETWTEAVLAVRSARPAVSGSEALAMVEKSPFNIRVGLEQLQQLYASASEPLRLAATRRGAQAALPFGSRLNNRMLRQGYKVGYRFLPRLLRPKPCGPVVLLYHSVEECFDTWTNRLGHNITPRRFEDHVRFLTEHFRVVPFSRICRGDAAPDEVAITFDDGSASLADAVLPIIEKYRCPIKVYLTTENLTEINWLNKLCYLLNVLDPAEQANLAQEALAAPPPRGRALGIHDFVHNFDAERTPTAIDEFFRKVYRGGARRLYLTEAEARRLAAHPLVEIGSHTRRHYPLPRLDAQRLHEEVVDNHHSLNSLFDNHVQGFAVPFGFRAHLSADVVRAVGEVDSFIVSAYGGRLDLQPCHGLPEVKRISAGGNLGALWYRLSHPN